MFAICIVIGIFLVLAAIPGQALAQIYRPHGFDRSNDAVQLEIAVQEREEFDVFGERRANKERQSGSWTMFGRLGIINFEKQAGVPDDGFTLKRSGPKLGRLTIGIRRRF